MEEKYTLTNISKICQDDSSNIYVLDSKSNTIISFDKKGRFRHSFFSRGNGPGESQFSWNMAVVNNMLLVDDPASYKVLYFDLHGNFSYEIKISDSFFPERFSAFNNKIVGFAAQQIFENEKMFSSYNFCIFDDAFKCKKKITQNKTLVDQNYNFLDNELLSYAVKDNNLYVSDKDFKKYKINLFNQKGNLIKIIYKNHLNVKFNNEEWENFKQKYKKKTLFYNNKSQIKNAILRMWIDKNDALWVEPAISRNASNKNNVFIDIFDKKGVFLNRIELAFIKYREFSLQNNIYFLNSYLYYIDNDNEKIDIYEYNY